MLGIDARGLLLIGASTVCIGCGGDSPKNSGAGGGAQAGGTSSAAGTAGAGGGPAPNTGGVRETGGSAPASGVSTGGGGSGGTNASAGGTEPFSGTRGSGTSGGIATGGVQATGGYVPAVGSTTGTGGVASTGLGGAATGGKQTAATGTGTAAGGPSTGGTSMITTMSGTTSGGAAIGGSSSGGAATGGSSSGGAATGGSSSGGAATGGSSSGSAATGGSSSGGAATGGATGGAATGGTSTGGGNACPTSSDFVGSPTWLDSVQVTATAEYCGTAKESRTLEQELATKAKLRIAAGTYPLPDSAGSYPFAWPICIQFPAGQVAPKFAGAGQMTLNRSVHSPTEYYTYRQSQPLSSVSSGAITFYGDLSNTSTVGARPTPLVLDGSPPEALGSRQYDFGICSAASCMGASDVQFYSCNSSKDRLQRDTIVFSGGSVVFEARIGQSMASTEPSAFVSAAGNLDGTAFEQISYWKLVYRPAHHHVTRDYAVLFDSPIGAACGLKAVTVPETQTLELHTINCDLSEIQARSVSSVTTGH